MQYTPKDGFPYYFALAGNTDPKSLFSSTETFEFLGSIDEARATYRYAPDKWSIKQVVGHITDHERIKMHRAFLASRNLPTQLWGYDQNTLVENSRFEALGFQELITDFQNVRKASISFIEGLSENQLNLKGMANQYEITLHDFLKSKIGHEIHHVNIIKERYL
ncbi:DinB family protein [Flagellimonas sp. 2504JD4-2]